jgi:hypothetical protein
MAIQHKTFTKPGRVPRSDELVLGQLAINSADGKLYIELTSGLVVCVGTDINQLVSQSLLNASLLLIKGGINQDLADKAPIVHNHQISDIGTLQSVLNSKANQADVASFLNGSETRSEIEPTTKNIGDTWLELNSSNFPLYGWAWRWDGATWLSPDFQMDWSVNALYQRLDFFLHCNPAFNYYFKSLNSNSVTGQAQTSGNHWEFDLLSITAQSITSTIFVGTTTGNAANWTRRSDPIGVKFNVSSASTNLFYLIVQPHNSPGTLYAAIQLVYNLSRL